MRTVTDLLKHGGFIYISFENDDIRDLFMKNAEAEGFTYRDGTKPAERKIPYGYGVFLRQDRTILAARYAGRVSCSVPGMERGNLMVDYGKYLAGCDDYLFME
ncbi:MAG: hypothetical protein IJM42_07195 [Synergistes sp.]|nr:hypothetical protein [Synergistes sp.]